LRGLKAINPTNEGEIIEALILAAGRGERLSKIIGEAPKALAQLAGVPLIGRVLRLVKEVGVTDVYVVVGYRGDEIIKKIEAEGEGLHLRFIENPEWEKGNLSSLVAARNHIKNNFILLMSDHLFDPRILKHLLNKGPKGTLLLAVDRTEASQEDTKIMEKEGKIVDIGKGLERFNCVDIGIFLCSPKTFQYAEKAAADGNSELADCVRYAASDGEAWVSDIGEISSYVPKVRRNVKPFWFDIDTPDDIRQAKNQLVRSSGKSASDFWAHFVHRPIEDRIVYHLADSKVTPNQVTIAVNLVAYCTTALFFFGYLLLASVLTFVVGLMDGLDGKLARVRGQATKLGLLEHPFDLLFEFSWFIALALFLSQTGYGTLPLGLCALTITFIAFYRHCYDQFGRAMGRSLDDYGNFERKFRRVAGRRNLYNIHILGWVLIGYPVYALVTILCHSILTAVVYALRAGIHMHAADKS
jgi:CDP-L-myo-inositol myo-inositolphosphotransferase